MAPKRILIGVLCALLLAGVAEKGGLPPAMRRGQAENLLARWTTVVATRTQTSELLVRLRLHAVSAVISHYAGAAPAEMSYLTQMPVGAEKEMERHMGELARRIILGNDG